MSYPPGTTPEEESEAPVPLEKRHPPIWWLIQRFQLSIDAFREMLDEFLPNLRELDRRRLSPNALAALDSLSIPDQQKLEAAFQQLVDDVSARPPDEAPRTESDPATDATAAAFAGEVKEIFADDQYAFMMFVQGISNAISGPSRTSIVLNSFLTMAISSFEVLIAGVITRFFIAHPSALSTVKEFSLDDIEGFESIEDAKDLLLSRKVSDLMYKGLDEWAAWFKKQCKADLSDLAMNWESVREAFQRRHLVIHSGGLVSSEYLAKVKTDGDPPSIGSRLPVTDEYLRGVFDELDALGTLLGTLAWGTWIADEREACAQQLVQRSYQTMLLGRWPVTEKLASAGDGLQCSESTKHVFRVNGWLSVAARDGFDAIQAQVEAWDVSALAGRFRLVKLVLSGSMTAAVQLIPQLLSNKELSLGEIREWPVFERLRDSPEFADLAGTLGIGDHPSTLGTKTTNLEIEAVVVETDDMDR